MDKTTKQPVKLKLEIKKETLRVLDAREMELLDGVVGGTGPCKQTAQTRVH